MEKENGTPIYIYENLSVMIGTRITQITRITKLHEYFLDADWADDADSDALCNTGPSSKKNRSAQSASSAPKKLAGFVEFAFHIKIICLPAVPARIQDISGKLFPLIFLYKSRAKTSVMPEI